MFSRSYRRWLLMVGLVALWSTPGGAQAPAAKRYLPIGLFFGQIEEGARVFTPARLLPFDHPEALGHEFPTLQQLHATEFPALVWLGAQAGLRLWPTLQRYPTEPSATWSYPEFQPPPDTAALRLVPVVHRPRAEATVPGLRAVLYAARTPILFIVDTRRLTLAERGMRAATTMGLDLSRAEFVAGLERAAAAAPAAGLGAVIFDP